MHNEENSSVSSSLGQNINTFLQGLEGNTSMRQNQVSADSNEFPSKLRAFAVILYGYDDWWLALPRGEEDLASETRNCNWLYVANNLNDDISDPGITYLLKEKVKIVMSSCFLTDVLIVRTGKKNTFTLSNSEKTRIDVAFAERLDQEAKEAERISKERVKSNSSIDPVRENKPFQQKCSKRERETPEIEMLSPKTVAVAQCCPRRRRSMRILPLPRGPCVCCVILSLDATVSIFGRQFLLQRNNDLLCRVHLAYIMGPHCRLVEVVTNPTDTIQNVTDEGVLLHAFGPLIPLSDVRCVAGADASIVLSAPCRPIESLGLDISHTKSLEASRHEDFRRRRELEALASEPNPSLVAFGSHNWSFSGFVIPPPCFSCRPKGIIPKRSHTYHHFIHNGTVHSVPIELWNQKISEVAACRFSRDSAKEAELAARNFFCMLQQMRHT